MTDKDASGRIDFDVPRWDQSTFYGRLCHYFWMTDWRTVTVTSNQLYKARDLLQQYRESREPPNTTESQLWYAKKLTLSAFHPDSGELQNVIGRMSCQVPGGMIITAGMLQFYKTNTGVILWQWINQSFNALVNYTNRNAASELTSRQIGIAYVSATSSALVTALGLKAMLAKSASSLFQRFVPFAAVAAANMVNIPLSRQSELTHGIVCCDENGNQITKSRYAAVKGIGQVVFSRIVIAAPGMLVMPVIMETLEKRAWFSRLARYHLLFQTLMIGCFLTVMVPVGCSLFPQQCSISLDKLKVMDQEKYDEVMRQYGKAAPKVLYFNKGL